VFRTGGEWERTAAQSADSSARAPDDAAGRERAGQQAEDASSGRCSRLVAAETIEG
jgi:hypothetical protein